MKEIIQITRGERGSVTVVALVLLMALTLLGISASRTSTTDIRIAANEIPYKDGFFVAEGGVNRESIEVGNGNYGVLNIYAPNPLGCQGDEAPDDCPNTLPPPAPHAVDGDPYDFELWYEGYFNPPSGYSPLYCSRYDYTAKDVELQDPNRGNVQMASRFYRIGPKAH